MLFPVLAGPDSRRNLQMFGPAGASLGAISLGNCLKPAEMPADACKEGGKSSRTWECPT